MTPFNKVPITHQGSKAIIPFRKNVAFNKMRHQFPIHPILQKKVRSLNPAASRKEKPDGGLVSLQGMAARNVIDFAEV